MQKYNSKNSKNPKINYNMPKDKSINRFWSNAARLEHSNVRNKNKGKKR